jgi:hypothetical protein
VMRLRAALPEAAILVGRWGSDSRADEARARLVAAGASEVGTSLVETREQVRALLPVLTRVGIAAETSVQTA